MLEKMTRDDLPDGVMDIVDTIGIDAFKDLVGILQRIVNSIIIQRN